MPIFYQENISEATRLGIWKIEEDLSFFKKKVPLHREVTHPHKMLQHLAGRFLLQHLFPDFPYHLVQIADTRKPFLENEAFHFSISHCDNYAAAIVSTQQRVGIDIELANEKVVRISKKFVSEREQQFLQPQSVNDYTQIWSAKEAVFKWYGLGKVDFKGDIILHEYIDTHTLDCSFAKTGSRLKINCQQFDELHLSYIF